MPFQCGPSNLVVLGLVLLGPSPTCVPIEWVPPCRKGPVVILFSEFAGDVEGVSLTWPCDNLCSASLRTLCPGVTVVDKDEGSHGCHG